MNEEVNQALKMLEGGSTRGMVIAHFRRQGLSAYQSNELVLAAARIVNRRILVRSIGILTAGVFAIVVGVTLFMDNANNKLFDAQTAGIVTMTGLISTIFGLLEMCRNRM